MQHAFRVYRSRRKSLETYVRPFLAKTVFQRPFGKQAKRVLFVNYPSNVAISQIDPFFIHYAALKARHDVEFRACSLSEFMRAGRDGPCGADIVLLQTWYDLSEEEKSILVSKLNDNHPGAKLVYLDWFAPLDLRLAEFLNEKVTLYVKKQIFRDLGQYGRPTLGETNVIDYYARLYGLAIEAVCYPVSADFKDKLVLGPGFFTAYYLMEGFRHRHFARGPRPIDLNARITTKGNDWYGMMRRQAFEAAVALKDCDVVTGVGISRREYLAELGRSKMCFSPFGYGEVCWRDFEAMMTGSLLLKPDVSHLVTDPDVFIAGETYVPIAWDFSDLAEKVDYYRRHEDERARIANNAFDVVQRYFKNGRFGDFAGRILSL